MTNEEKLDYLAGFFDAEGCVYFSGGVAIFSSYVPVLESAKRQFSGNVLVNKSKRAREWRTTHKNATAFLRLVEPYLVVKSEVTRKVLSLSDLMKNSRKLMVCDSRGMNRSFPDSVVIEMKSLVDEVKELNRRGPTPVEAD